MSKIISFLSIAFVLFSCNSGDEKGNSSNSNSDLSVENSIDVDAFFYPKDSIVQMYVYQNTKNAEDKYFERVVYKRIDGLDHFFISRYNIKMEPISTMSYWNVDGQIELKKANIMVGRVSYEGKITKDLLFANRTDVRGQINFDYPVNDSIINVIEVNRSFLRRDTIEENKESFPVIVFQDSMRLSIVDIKNQQHKSVPMAMDMYYAEGIGKFMETNSTNEYRLILRTDYKTFMSFR
jgi:hypothetical protein